MAIRTYQYTLIKLLFYFFIKTGVLHLSYVKIFFSWVKMMKIQGTQTLTVFTFNTFTTFVFNSHLFKLMLSFQSLVAGARLAVRRRMLSSASRIKFFTFFLDFTSGTYSLFKKIFGYNSGFNAKFLHPIYYIGVATFKNFSNLISTQILVVKGFKGFFFHIYKYG